MGYTIQHIATIVKGRVTALHHDAMVSELLTDSRRAVLPERSLFVALKGPRRDGHRFLKEAHSKGVRNFMVSEEPAEPLPESNIILVRDALVALQVLAAYHRSKFSIPVIGITGSNGKTIVKEWLNQLLETRYAIVRSPKSYNSQVGVPLSVWQLNDTAGLAIFEAGISQSEEMDKLQRIIQPTIGVFTNIGDAHSEGFLNNHQKVREKLRLFSNVSTLIYCKDYHEVHEGVAAMYRQLKTGTRPPFRIISWSKLGDAELRITSIEKRESHTQLRARFEEEELSVSIPFIDNASIENAIHCWCVLLHLQLPAQAIQAGMAALHPVAMRLELRNGINDTSIINDSYSADISSLRIALDFLSTQHQHPGRTVILTDLLQSGRSEKELYAEIARLLKQHEVNRLFGVGPCISRHQAAFQKYFSNGEGFVQFFPSVEDFLQQFPRLHFAHETILLKGARIFELEQVTALLEKQTHQTLLEINLDAVLHNLRVHQQLLRADTRIMAMVKAFSYGSGTHEIASALQFNKVDYLAVAYADEGVDLRKGGIRLPIMVMNPDESSFDTLVQHNLEPEIYSPELLDELSRFLKTEGLSQFPIHLELETGMNRLGFAESDLPVLIGKLQSPLFRVQSVFSHLVASEDPAFDAFTRQQGELFTRMSEAVLSQLSYPVIRHLLNSAGIARHREWQFDMVRIGIGLYGIDGTHALYLREVSTLRTSIAQLKRLHQGESVSYGRSGRVDRDSLIATVRLGYADGYPRILGNGRGKMLVNGQLVPTIGNICMDMTMLDVTDTGALQQGDEVIVFGQALPVAELARWADTIPYEILTGISQRVKRVYFQE